MTERRFGPGDEGRGQDEDRELLEAFSDTSRFILNAGCAIPPRRRPENLRAMIDMAREFR